MFSQERAFTDWQLTGFGSAPAFLFETIESTHKLMKAMASNGEIAPGTLFVADSQSNGHGRHERTWDSPAGKNLYFNILIPLEGIPANRFAQITQVAALTFAETFNNIHSAIQDSAQFANVNAVDKCATPTNANRAKPEIVTAPKITVKWPNDILFGKSKFCGILAEIVYTRTHQSGTTSENAPRPALNMGIGINVNSDPEDYAHLNRAVTTLKAIFGRTINREILLQQLIGNLERAIGQFKAFGIRPWVAAWKRMDQFIGARGTIVVNNRCTDQNRETGEGAIKKSGTIIDMQDDGSLLFKCDDGTIETVISADLEI
ncbi:biotin--[acetyl-CoA-carboxylase] ligase [Fibrobacter sp. UWB12]|uniref:biotin--[acetyl-CoA-carboxylase] ligase n=1 Tax=Fibrobacter sp. UWB12 TaxID=1896203 RepID=UPI000911DDB8|nr:biotin--[acetyl-CoA-carboxylase] ligase [Fibrobacter sp. UWB12]SHK74683.1 BirA family transcriptional regulator, biotin operon repressor / biotin-[acetyl-CoA-carboxylase] ligase [Fibrobacter sp. UWB12]